MAIKYMAGNRIIGTAAERAALTTSVAQTDLINTGDGGTTYNASSEGDTDVGFVNSSKTGFGQAANFPDNGNPSSTAPPEMRFQADFPSAQNWFGSGEYCIGCWAKLIDNDGDQEMFSLRTDGTNNYVKFYHWSANQFNGLVYINNGSYSYLRAGDDTGNDGNWHHFMVERSGSIHTLYIDNVSKATWDNNGTFGSFDQIRVGRWWEGELDEMFILARKTTSAEKTSLQSSVVSDISSMYTDSDLKVYYNCDSTHTYPNLVNGVVFEESDTGKHYMWDGTNTWNEVT